jgi:tetratricopeptide (TPR) repeat protein
MDVDVEEIIDEKYKILEELGRGGMGVVYKAEQIEPVKRTVALKVIKLGMDTREVVVRFETEKQALAVMSHPHIAKVLDAGATKSGRPYFVMEFVPGIPITDYCNNHKLTTKERIELFILVCEAVQHAHQKGVIHRDLKPSNVLVEIQDDKPVPKIIDFGIARATEHRLTEHTLFTERGQLIGTPEYMSPEQAEISELDVDTRTDIYSLGVMLYELLVGVLPFDSKTLRDAGFGEIQRIIREEEPPRASTRLSALGDTQITVAEQRKTDVASLHKQIKGDLDWILMKAMEKDRARRYVTATGVAIDLQRYFDNEPVMARPPSASYRMFKFAKRHKAGLSAGLVVATALVLGLVLATTGLIRAKRAEAVAASERDRASIEAETAKQVSDFLIGLFEISDPNEARGNTITAREILDRGAKNIQIELKDQPEVLATMMGTMGNVYLKLSLYEPAYPLLDEALSIRREIYGNEHLDVSKSINDLADWHYNQGEYEKAEALDRESVAICRKLFNKDHPDLATSIYNLGSTLHTIGDYDKAEVLYLEALTMRRNLFGNNNPDVAESLHDLAALYFDKSDYDKAESLYREALAVYRAVLGDEHLNLSIGIHSLAYFLHAIREQYEEAEELYREAIAIDRKLLGEDNPDYADSLKGLASLLSDKGDLEEAEVLFREVLRIHEKTLGKKHPIYPNDLRGLAILLKRKGEYEEAEILYREALASYREIFNEKQPELATGINDLAFFLHGRGEYEEAESLYNEALELYRNNLGEKHLYVSISLRNIANLHFSKGNYQEAEPLYRKSLEIGLEVLPEGQKYNIQSRRELGWCLTRLKKFDEAEQFLLKSYELQMTKEDEISKADIPFILKSVIELYKDWGKTEKATEYEEILEKIK